MRRLAVMLAVLAFSWPVSAIADSHSGYCDRLGQQVQVYRGDPSGLDYNGDGIGCDNQPGPPLVQNANTTIGEFPGQYPNPPQVLAKTGASDLVHEHPIRSMALGVVLVGIGACLVGLFRRKK